MSRNLKIYFDEFYHIYNRGSDKRLIFTCDADYQRFISLLFLSNSPKNFVFRDFKIKEKLGESLFDYDRGENSTSVGAYCLMPNHFHILLRETKEGGISSFIQKVCTGYSMYFNKKYQHSGTLFQGPFQIKHLDEDVYLKYIYSYIHINPLKLLKTDWKKFELENWPSSKKFLEDYRYSSYLDYVGFDRKEKLILNKKAFPEYFLETKEFEDFLADWQAYEIPNETLT